MDSKSDENKPIVQQPDKSSSEDICTNPTAIFFDHREFLIYKRHNLGNSLLEKRSTFYITDTKHQVICVAKLKLKKADQDLSDGTLLIDIVDQKGDTLFQLKRKLSHIKSCTMFESAEMSIKSAIGANGGKVKKDYWSNNFTIISNESGQKLALQQIGGKYGKIFEIRENRKSIGKIVKSYDRLEEAVTIGGQYKVTVAETVADEMKSLIIFSVFLLDFIFYEPPRPSDSKVGTNEYAAGRRNRNDSNHSCAGFNLCCLLCSNCMLILSTLNN